MARLAVLLTARSRDQVPPTSSTRVAQGAAARRPGAARPLPGIQPVALSPARWWAVWPSSRTARSWDQGPPIHAARAAQPLPSVRPVACLAVLLTAWSRPAPAMHPAPLSSARPTGGPSGCPSGLPEAGPGAAHPLGQGRPGRHSALPWSRPAIAWHPAHGPQSGPLVGRRAVL